MNKFAAASLAVTVAFSAIFTAAAQDSGRRLTPDEKAAINKRHDILECVDSRMPSYNEQFNAYSHDLHLWMTEQEARIAQEVEVLYTPEFTNAVLDDARLEGLDDQQAQERLALMKKQDRDRMMSELLATGVPRNLQEPEHPMFSCPRDLNISESAHSALDRKLDEIVRKYGEGIVAARPAP